jgi:hypothetical protein
MLVTEFSDTASQYENFEVWEIHSFDDFLNGNGVITEIVTKEFGLSGEKLDEIRNQPLRTNTPFFESVLDMVNEKHFLVFDLHTPNHLTLVGMQNSKTMNFGIDIAQINADYAYVLIMDKKRNSAFG